MQVQLIKDGQHLLGEGLLWHAPTNRLFHVDIHGCSLHALDLGTGQWHEWRTDQRLGWVLPTGASDVLVAGFQEGFALVRAQTGAELVVSWLAKPFGAGSTLRLNDAKVDSAGAIWAGSLDNAAESKPHGALYRLDPDGRVAVMDTGYCVANGPAIAPAGGLMLHTDSVVRKIFAFDLDHAAGLISNKRLWREFSEQEGHPDGMTFDASGNVWVAHWGGACVSQFNPEGDLLQRVQLPVSQVTNVCFGGPSLDRLFVTSARVGLSEQALAHEPLAGAVFEVLGHGAIGVHSPAFAGACQV